MSRAQAITTVDIQTSERFWAKAQDQPGEDCWEWQASKDPKGYGHITINSKTVSAHRLAYATRRGSVPEGIFVLHACDNPGCVNPSHLFLGDGFDNQADKTNKGRHHSTKVTHCPQGHEYTEENTVYQHSVSRPNGGRGCRICRRRWSLEAYYRNKGKTK
jgi:hypothetical protein